MRYLFVVLILCAGCYVPSQKPPKIGGCSANYSKDGIDVNCECLCPKIERRTRKIVGGKYDGCEVDGPLDCEGGVEVVCPQVSKEAPPCRECEQGEYANDCCLLWEGETVPERMQRAVKERNFDQAVDDAAEQTDRTVKP